MTTTTKKTKYDPIVPAAALTPHGLTQYGKHKIQHASITEGIANLMGSEKADLIYSDPPWGQGNIKFWQTTNAKMNPEWKKQDLDLQNFLHTLMGFYKNYSRPGAHILIEYGQQWHDELVRTASHYGLIHGGSTKLQYRSGSKLLPLDLLVFGNGTAPSIPAGFMDEVRDTYGYPTLKVVFKHFAVPGGMVLDPCCGMGYTAQAAIDFGMTFRGNEMNHKRLQVTANRLFKTMH